MFSTWLDATHRRLWRLADDSPDLCAVEGRARQLTAAVEKHLKSLRDRNACGWTAEKGELLAALDKAHLPPTISSAGQPISVPLGLVLLELAALDGGLATIHLSRCLAQMPIADFGTAEQKDRYLSGKDLLHGALCLTEPIPGAGAEALLLMGTCRPVADGRNEALWIEIDKRGRFTSHMEFADFAVAAVKGIDGARGSALVILEPHDAGEFDRGMPVRKIGHRMASTTNPSFRLRVPASRIVGGYAMESGLLQPHFDHRRLLEPALRRTRAVLSLMTAAKALATVANFSPARRSGGPEFWLLMADLWAAGEAAASLGFLAARISDRLDSRGSGDAAATADTNLFVPAAKLFATTRTIPALSQVAAAAGSGVDDLRWQIADAQVEAVYMGPEASQRRLISAAMAEKTFAASLAEWIDALDRRASSFPTPAPQCLAAGFRLWLRTFSVLQERIRSNRQATTFAMADSLCALLAARSFLLDAVELEGAASGSLERETGIFRDLVWLASVRAASQAAQTSIGLICGDAERVPLPRVLQNELAVLRARVYAGATAFQYARERIAGFLSNRNRETEIA
jgi:hypothetical protein